MSLRRQIGALFLAATSFAGIANAQQKPVEIAQNNLVGKPSMNGSALNMDFKNSSVPYVKSADDKAQDLSMQEKVVGISVLIGSSKDPKAATGEQIAQGLQKVLTSKGIPSKYFVDTIPQAGGAVINFFIDGDAHLDSLNRQKPSSDFNMRGAFGEIPYVVDEFKDKYPEAVMKPITEIPHLPTLTAEKR